MSRLIQNSYPSRVEDRARLIPRRDPVVWGDTASRAGAGPLGPQDLRRYERDGFVFKAGMFSPEEVGRVLEEVEKLGRAGAGREEVILEPGSSQVRSLFAVDRVGGPFFQRLARDSRLLGMAQQILGSPVYVHQSRVNLKPGFRGEQFDWHSDFETWHVEDGMAQMRAVSISLLLTENNAFNGPLMLVPGSHRTFVSCVGQTPEDHYRESLRKQRYGVPDAQSLTELINAGGIQAPVGPAGSVLVFDCNTMHGSTGNLSPWARSNAFLVYNSVENTLVEPFGGRNARPEFIASREFAGLEPVSGALTCAA